MVVRQYDDELKYIERLTDYSWRIKKDFQPNMNVEGNFVNKLEISPKNLEFLFIIQEFSTLINTWKNWCSRSCEMRVVQERWVDFYQVRELPEKLNLIF